MKNKLVLIIIAMLVIFHLTKDIVHYDLLLAGVFGLAVVSGFFILFSLPFLFIATSIIMLLCGKWKAWTLFLKKHITISTGKSNYDEVRIKQERVFPPISSFKTQPVQKIHDIHSGARPISSLPDHHRINPASGLPMAGRSSIDIGGNVFGTKR